MAFGRDRDSTWEETSTSNVDSPALYRMRQQNPVTLFAPQNRQTNQRTANNSNGSSRNYDDIDGRNAYRSNANVDWTRASFKIKKSKPGKIRHLSKGELFGIGMSFVLSVCFAVIMAMAMVYLTPIIMKHFTNFLYDVREVGNIAQRSVFPSENGETTYLTVLPHLSEEDFLSICYKQLPCVFTTKDTNITDLQQQFHNNVEKVVDITDIHQKKVLRSFSFKNFVSESLSCAAATEESKNTVMATIQLSKADSSNFATFGRSIFQGIFGKPQSVYINSPVEPFNNRPLNVHRGNLNLLLNGKQRWIVYKHDKLPKKGFNNALSTKELLGQEDSKGNAFVLNQGEGEHVYIPEGWMFGYELLTDDVAVNIQYDALQVDSSSYFQFYSSGKEKYLHGDITGAIKLYKLGLALNRNVLLLEGMGDALVANAQYLAAEEFFREALSLNPRSVTAYSKLINLFINHAAKDVSESIAELLTQASAVGIREYVLQSTQDSL